MTDRQYSQEELDAAEALMQAQRDDGLITRAKRAGLELRWCPCTDAWLLCGPAWRICTGLRSEVMAAVRLQERGKDRSWAGPKPKRHALFALFDETHGRQPAGP